MAAFDRSVWKKRADKRLADRLARRPASQQQHKKQHIVDEKAADAIERLVTWCEGKKLKVDFSKSVDEGGTFYGPKMIIEINRKLMPESQLHLLLHECGHFLMFLEANDCEDSRYDRVIFDHDDGPSKRSLNHKLLVIEEEFEAWYRGKKLGEKLKLNVDEEAFNKTKASSIKTYLQWAIVSRKPGKKRSKSTLAPGISTPTLDLIIADEEKKLRAACPTG